jgi:hypothetical protein
MDAVPEHLKRYPSRAGREGLAARLGLTIDPYSQDWEWEVADPTKVNDLLALYRNETLSDDERFSLMEMLIQCVNEMAPSYGPQEEVEELPQWQALARLLKPIRGCTRAASLTGRCSATTIRRSNSEFPCRCGEFGPP